MTIEGVETSSNSLNFASLFLISYKSFYQSGSAAKIDSRIDSSSAMGLSEITDMGFRSVFDEKDHALRYFIMQCQYYIHFIIICDNMFLRL